jgi:signal transduction histidine kinase
MGARALNAVPHGLSWRPHAGLESLEETFRASGARTTLERGAAGSRVGRETFDGIARLPDERHRGSGLHWAGLNGLTSEAGRPYVTAPAGRIGEPYVVSGEREATGVEVVKEPNVGDALIASCVKTKLALTLDELPDGVLVVSADGRVEAANLAFLELTDRRLEQVLEKSFESLVAEEDMLGMVGFEAMFGDHRTLDNNVIFVSPDGTRRSLIVCSVHSRDEQFVIMTARPSGTVQEELADASRWVAAEQDRALELARARDALAAKNDALSAAQAELENAYAKLQSEAQTRERLENELSMAQRLEAIGQLASGIAHEINTPMQYIGDNVHFLSGAFSKIVSYLAILTAALEDGVAAEWGQARSVLLSAQKKLKLQFLTGEVPKALEASRDGIAHVAKIVQAMKAFAHVDESEMTPGDINQTLRDTLTVAQNEYKNLATVETDFGELPAVRCFVGKLNQVFLNLIVNAAHAIEDAKKPGLGVLRVSSRAADDWVEVRIQDDGCGIPERIRHQIFDQFFTTKQVGRGSGQGLSLARAIVLEAHAGSLTFESEVGVGTTFIVRVPVNPP